MYRRNQAFRKSVNSALGKSAYSHRWSSLSDLSLAELSDISVINLAITEGEVFNHRRSSQTWSAETDQGLCTDRHVDGRRRRPKKIYNKSSTVAQESRPTSPQPSRRGRSRTPPPSPRRKQADHPNVFDHSEELWEEFTDTEESEKIRSAETLRFKCRNCNKEPEKSRYTSTSKGIYCIECFKCRLCDKKLEKRRYNHDSKGILCMECFKCRKCDKKLEKGRHNQTSKGVYCMECCRCRNCSKKLENFKYASNAMGIYCIDCFKCRACDQKLRKSRSVQGMWCTQCYEVVRPGRSDRQEDLPKSRNDTGFVCAKAFVLVLSILGAIGYFKTPP